MWDATLVYREHGRFIWATLQRMGVSPSDLPDAMQETLIVVHRNLDRYDPAAKITAWLFGICRRVAASFRRRAHRRHEDLPGEFVVPEPGASPEELVGDQEARVLIEAILDKLDPEKRAVFVMFEVDRLTCPEIAELIGVPVGTVYSRLHAARQEVTSRIARMRRVQERRPA